MNLLDTVISISVVLTILSLLLLLLIVGVHLFAGRHARREADFRKTAEPAVESYFADPARLEAAPSRSSKRIPKTL